MINIVLVQTLVGQQKCCLLLLWSVQNYTTNLMYKFYCEITTAAPEVPSSTTTETLLKALHRTSDVDAAGPDL